MTVTGSNADHRFTCASGAVLDALCSLLAEQATRVLIPNEELRSSIRRMGERASHGLAPRQVGGLSLRISMRTLATLS